MATKLPIRNKTGLTLYAQILTMTEQIYRPDTLVFETPLDTWTTYDIPIPESALPTLYFLTWPAAMAAGIYHVDLYHQLAGAPASTDACKGGGDFWYDGTNAILPASAAALALVQTKTDLIPAAPAAVGDIPTEAEILAVFKADAEWRTILAGVNGDFTFNPTTGVLILKDKAGAVTLATLTLTKDVLGNITVRASV